MTSSLPAGFKNLPVSKIITSLTLFVPLVASLSNVKYLFYYAYDPFILQYNQFWRLFTFQLAYLNESEVLLGVVLLYQFRSLERLYSSHKYLSTIIVTYLYVLIITSLNIAFNFYLGIQWINAMASGPTAILFALLFQYSEYVPVMYKFEIYGTSSNKLVLSEQSFLYLLSFQLAISQGLKSVGAATLGWCIGALVCRGMIPGKGWRIPFWKAIAKKQAAYRAETPVPVSGDPNNNNDEDATETRPLSTQFLDTFRR